MNEDNKANIITVALIILLIVGGFFGYSYYAKNDNKQVIATQGGGDPGLSSMEIRALLNILEQTELEIELFNDKLFRDLTSGIPLESLPEVESGRPNPFLPLK